MTGIDVSHHQGVIDWDTVKDHVDFAIIRLGYGKGHADKCGVANIEACERLNIPYGIYWFSYATSALEAEAEARYCIELLGRHRPALPIYWDFEYDSEHCYKMIMGNYFDRSNIPAYANRFCTYIERCGFRAGIYTNLDMLPYFKNSYNGRSLWYAQWGTKNPQTNCDIWQRSSTGNVPGIAGNVDMNEIINEEVLQVSNKRYQSLDDIPAQYRSKVEQYIKAGVIAGKDTGLDLTEDMIRCLIYADRLVNGGAAK